MAEQASKNGLRRFSAPGLGAAIRRNAVFNENRIIHNDVLNSLNCGIFAYTVPQLELITINDEARRIIGCGDNDNVSEAFSYYLDNMIAPEDRERVFSGRELLRTPGDTVSQTYKVITKEGRAMFVRNDVKLLRLASGGLYFVMSLYDITDATNLSKELKKERRSYFEALSKGCEFCFFLDVTEGLIHDDFSTAHNVNPIRISGLETPVSFDEFMEKYREFSYLTIIGEGAEENFTREGILKAYSMGITNLVTEFYSPKTNVYSRVHALLSEDDETGHIHAYIFASDITEAKEKDHLHTQLLENINDRLHMVNNEMHTRLDAILSGIAGGLTIIDTTHDYGIVYMSKGAAELFGYTTWEFAERFNGRLAEEYIRFIDTGGVDLHAEAARQIKETGMFTMKYRIHRRDGSTKWIIDHGKLIRDNGSNLYYILMQDITELEEHNRRLKDLLEMQKLMAELLGSGILAYTIPDRKILLMNREAENIFETSSSVTYASGFNAMEKLLPEDRETVIPAVRKLKAPGDSTEYIFHNVRKNGSVMTYKCSTKLLEFSDKQQYILSSINDITQQEAMELQLNEERRQYRNALALGCEVFLNMDLSEGMLSEPIVTNNGQDFTAEIGIELPAYYDDLSRKWFDSERIVCDSEDVDIIRSRKRLISAYKQGRNVFDFEYHIPGKEQYIHALILLYKINDHIHISFIMYDISDERIDQRKKTSIIASLGNIYSEMYHFSLSDGRYTTLKSHEDSGVIPDEGLLSLFRRDYVNAFAEGDDAADLADLLDPETLRRRLKDTDHVTIDFNRKGSGAYHATLVTADRDSFGNPRSVVFAAHLKQG